jgi:hypothetical protein
VSEKELKKKREEADLTKKVKTEEKSRVSAMDIIHEKEKEAKKAKKKEKRDKKEKKEKMNKV